MNSNTAAHFLPLQGHVCRIAGGQPCVGCQESSALENYIGNMERELATLRSKRFRTFNAYHDPITTRLPAEVVSNIFIKLTESPLYGGSDVTFSEEGGTFELLSETQYQWIPPIYPSKWRLKQAVYTPLQLGNVCWAWRQIAWSTPQLWTKIGVDIGHDDLTMEHAERLKEYLDRSKTLPLRLNIVADKDTRVDMQTLAMIFVLLAHSRRWVYLDLSLPLDIAMLLCCNSAMRPELKELKFFHVETDHDDEDDEDDEDSDDDAPMRKISINASPQHLTHLILDASSPLRINVDWNNLTHVHMDIRQAIDLFHLLECAPQLTHLIISCLRYLEDEDSQFPSLIEHTHLKYFELRDVDSEGCLFLENMSLPALEEFRTWNHWHGIELNSALNRPSFLRSLVSLSRVTIEYCVFHGSFNVVPVLENVPSLEYLELIIKDDGDDTEGDSEDNTEVDSEDDTEVDVEVDTEGDVEDDTEGDVEDDTEGDSEEDPGSDADDPSERRNIDPFLKLLSEYNGRDRARFLPNMKELYVHGHPELSWNLIPAIISSSAVYNSRVDDPDAMAIDDQDYSAFESLRIAEGYRRPLSLLRFDFELYESAPHMSKRNCLLLLPFLNRGVSLIIGEGLHPGTILQAELDRHRLH